MRKLVSVLLTVAVMVSLLAMPAVVSANGNTAAVNLTANVGAITAIDVEPTSIDFGDVTPGTTVWGDPDHVTVTNIGAMNVDVGASLDPAGGVFRYLFLNEVESDSGDWSPVQLGMTNMLPTDNKTCSAKLVVPKTYSAHGPESTTLIFEATSITELYELTTSVSPDGSGSVEPSSGTYSAGTVVDLEATAASGWEFASWTGTDNDAVNPTTVTMDSDKSVTATFEEIPVVTYTLSISSTDGGSVTTPGEGTYTYNEGEVVNLVAEADDGYEFVSWTGTDDNTANPTTVTMDSDKSVTAYFEEIPVVTYTLSISSTEGGSVTTPSEGNFIYDAGTVVNLVAEADSGYEFASWTGDTDTIADVNAASTTITMDGDYSIMANFEAVAPQLPTWAVGNNWVYGYTYDSGTGVTNAGEMNIEVTDTAEANYTLFADYVPDANRTDATTGSPLVVLEADVFINKANMLYLKQHASIKAYGFLADDATITWTYTPIPGWPFDMYNFTKHTVDALDIVNKTDTRQGKLLGIEDVTVPAGTFSCLHIVEYDPADSGTITYEHWFNPTVVKSDVKMIDRETYKGVETRVLTSYNVA